MKLPTHVSDSKGRYYVCFVTWKTDHKVLSSWGSLRKAIAAARGLREREAPKQQLAVVHVLHDQQTLAWSESREG